MKSLLLLFILIQQSVWAQDSLKWVISAEGGPNYSYRRLVNGNGSTQSDHLINIWDSIEDPLLGYGVSINGKRALNNYMRIQLGIGFNEVGVSTKTGPFTFAPGTEPDPLPVSVHTKTYWQFIETSAAVSVGTFRKKLCIGFTAGVGLSRFINLRDRDLIKYDDGTERRVVTNFSPSEGSAAIVNSWNGFFFFQPEAELHATPRFTIGLAPGIKYYLAPMHNEEDDPIKAFFYSANFNFLFGYLF